MVVVRGGGMYEENENRESKERTIFTVERENEINHILKKTKNKMEEHESVERENVKVKRKEKKKLTRPFKKKLFQLCDDLSRHKFSSLSL
jgi:hypothetical protein